MIKTILVVLILTLGNINNALATERILITINQFVDHPSLDATTEGLRKSLRNRGFTPDKVEIRLDNAQGNMTNTAQIANHQAALHPAVMVAIATPSAQVSLKARKLNSLLAFAAVTDPKAAGLTVDNVIGVSDKPQIDDILKILKQVLPKAKTIGVLFNPGEINSVTITEEMEKLALINGFKIEKAVINSSSNIKLVMQKLLPHVDVIYLPQDNLIFSSIETFAKISLKAKIPLVANVPSAVDQGLLFALGSDYFQDGMQLGNMIADHLSGVKVIPNIQLATIKTLRFNKKVAEKLNITIPKNL